MREKTIRHLLTAAAAVVITAAAAIAQAQTVINVSTAAQLQSAVATANSSGGNRVIQLADGTYTVNSLLNITAPNVTIAGQAGHRANVIIQGDAMSANAAVLVVFRVDASNFSLHDVTVQHSAAHAIQIVGEDGAKAPVIRDCVLRDTYQMLLKVSQDPNKATVTSDDGVVQNCIFEYTAGAGPESYIGGIDALGARNWTVRGNTFRNIISPNTGIAGPAVQFWSVPTGNNLVEQNTIVNCDRGIGFGLDASVNGTTLGGGNSGGIIRNNMIYHAANNGQFADTGIELNHSPNTQVYNNTVLLQQSFPWAIDYRFADTTGVLIENNATSLPILARDNAAGTVGHNVTNAVASWFVSPSTGDLHLASAVPTLVGQGVAITGLTTDFDGNPRPQGAAVTIGAQEWTTTATVRPNPPTNVQAQ